jgi:hypothetical protein
MPASAELVQHGVNGTVFNNATQLCEQIHGLLQVTELTIAATTAQQQQQQQ